MSALFSLPASAEVFASDPVFEISGFGARSSRNCTVGFKPMQTFGDSLAPRLILETQGGSRLSFGVERSSQYSSIAIVQDNARRPFSGMDNVLTEQFRASDISKVMQSKQVFFITARRADSGKYVSSRYERLDFDAILEKLEANCPFDAESLMKDVSARERIESSLSISASDLLLIRGALNSKYSGSSTKPEARLAMSPAERGYLKRYAAENGLPPSQFLTSETSRRLIQEGRRLEGLAKPPPPPPPPAPPPALAERKPFWSLDDSTLELRADKSARTFVFDQPGETLRRLGVGRGTAAFTGSRAKNTYLGTAYAFSRGCPPVPFRVTGSISEDQRQVTLYGSAPVRDAACRRTGNRDQILQIVFHDELDNWGR